MTAEQLKEGNRLSKLIKREEEKVVKLARMNAKADHYFQCQATHITISTKEAAYVNAYLTRTSIQTQADLRKRLRDV